jgi:hypothetical protein
MKAVKRGANGHSGQSVFGITWQLLGLKRLVIAFTRSVVRK